ESANGKFPTSGEGTDYTTNPPSTTFDKHSTYTYLLPFIEQGNVYAMMDLNYYYADPARPGNQAAAKTKIGIFLFPSHPYRQEDPQGYGQCDYMPVAYTDIDPVTGVCNRVTRTDGILHLGGSTVAECSDGTSNTIAIIEDVGKNHESFFPY